MVESESCSLDDKRNALERAIASQTFAKSEQLRSFLRYICEAEWSGATGALNEYVIGVEVLHRPADYSTAEDSSVRTRAYELRQKLSKLYATELPNEPVRIVIPKGAYSPRFERVAELLPAFIPDVSFAPVPVPAPHIQLKAPVQEANRWPVWVLCAAVAIVAALLGGALAFSFTRKAGSSRLDPIVEEAWAPFAARDDSVMLVAATPLYLVLGPATHQAFGTTTYPAPAAAYPIFRQHRPLAADAKLGMVFTNDALGVGNMNAVVLASNTIRAMGAKPQILPERAAMMSFLHGRHAVLFGAPVDSAAISEILDKTPLSVVYDESVQEFVIRDRTNGERLVPEKEPNGDFRSVYGLITVLNTRESDHGRLGLLVFSGITSVGTHGAAEYFTSPRSLQALRGIFAKEGMSGFPAAYQVVVKCKFDNMLLVAAEYHAHRILR